MGKHLGSHDYVQTLKGQTLRFPNLDGLVKTWPTGFSSHYDALKQVHNAEMYQFLGPGSRYEALVAVDCAYLATTWFPNATWEALRMCAHFVAFLYIWDNEIDSPEFSSLSADWDAGEQFRQATIVHVKKYLDPCARNETGLDKGVHFAITSFNPVGERGAFRLTTGQRAHFLREVIRFVEAVGSEQKSELSGQAPTIDEYLPVRMGTSAVQAQAALIEYFTGVDLGDDIRSDPDIQQIFVESNCIVTIMNDIFSLRRELQFPFYNNAVAVLYHEHQNLQAAVDATYKIVADSVAGLEGAAERALERYPERRDDLLSFIGGAKSMCTGNIAWSMHIPRYNLGVDKLDGTTEITI